MSGEELPGAPLSAPAVDRKHFARNFIKQAVCELRFPTLFELEGERPPADFAHSIRKEFPTHERTASIKLDGESVGKTHGHTFRSRKDRWTVSLRAASLSLETTHYDSFEEFSERLRFVLGAAKQIIDTDFFTRIGLRYINGISCSNSEVGGWVNPCLVSPLTSGVFGEPKEFWQRIVGTTDFGGGYLLQHGLAQDGKTGQPEYVLDYDFFLEDISVEEAVSAVTSLHDAQHQLFRWCLGQKAKVYIGLTD